ncbi:MAG TPA: hypothetical protein VFE50_05460 [Cyclobacteriaceae bacterium]|nr:hypothetical protein [Cyclobacteriaceae bacterium]
MKKFLRYLILGILILLAFCGVPIGAWLPNKKEMDIDDEVKTEIVEGTDESQKN